jgi:hypothetical protein
MSEDLDREKAVVKGFMKCKSIVRICVIRTWIDPRCGLPVLDFKNVVISPDFDSLFEVVDRGERPL